MTGIKDLLNSEHGFFGMVLMICATVLVALGRMTVDQWIPLAEWIFTAYAGAHGLVSIASAIGSKSDSAPTPALGSGSGGAGVVVLNQAPSPAPAGATK